MRNSDSARFAREIFIFVHFESRSRPAAMWNEMFYKRVDNAC